MFLDRIKSYGEARKRLEKMLDGLDNDLVNKVGLSQIIWNFAVRLDFIKVDYTA